MTTPRRILFATIGLVGAASLATAGPGCPNSAEKEAARTQAFAQADADGNGALSQDEFAGFHEAMQQAFAQNRFQKLDTNGDGQVTSDELAAGRPHRGPDGD
jgi:hypothetical protein